MQHVIWTTTTKCSSKTRARAHIRIYVHIYIFLLKTVIYLFNTLLPRLFPSLEGAATAAAAVQLLECCASVLVFITLAFSSVFQSTEVMRSLCLCLLEGLQERRFQNVLLLVGLLSELKVCSAYTQPHWFVIRMLWNKYYSTYCYKVFIV